MSSSSSSSSNNNNNKQYASLSKVQALRGIVPRAADEVLAAVNEMRRQGIEASLNVSYVEVFGDEVSERATRPLSNRNDQPTRVSVSDR